jgi:hypothetical protein
MVKKVKKTAAPKPKKKGFLNLLFGGKKEKTSSAAHKKEKQASLDKGQRKTPVKKPVAKKPIKTTVNKKVIGKKAEPTAPIKKGSISPKPKKTLSPAKPPLDEPSKEVIIQSSYTPEPFKGSHFLLQPTKRLTAEGWNRLFEILEEKK